MVQKTKTFSLDAILFEGGRFYDTKERLMELIAASSSSLQPQSAHVIPDWKFDSSTLQNLPLASVRVAPVNIDDPLYGRVMGGGTVPVFGSIAVFSFTIHVHTRYNDVAGEDKGKYAQQLGDKIIDYLILRSSEESVHHIADIYDLDMRESEPQGQRVARVIISGRMLCKRYD